MNFYEMAYMFIAYGLTLSCTKDPANIAMKSFNKIGRDKLRYIMLNTAYQKHRMTLNKFSTLPYASVSIDEGSTLGISTLHFVVESPLTKLKSYPFAAVQMNGGKTRDYIQSIPKGLCHLIRAGVTIGSIVIDGNTAQAKALRPSYKNSLYNHSDINDMEKILIVPCLCHRINNSLKKAVKENKQLNELVNLLHTLSGKFRNNKEKIGALCPAHNVTRWCYDFDIVKFILKHEKKIGNANEIVEDIPIIKFEKLKKVLTIFKVLISTFENPHTQMKDSFIFLERAINCLLELYNKHNIEYAKDLAESLETYTIKAKDGGIWSLAYCFSPKGHSDFRDRNIHCSNPTESSYLKYFPINDEDEDEEDIEVIEEDQLVTFKRSDEIMMTFNGQLANIRETDSDDDDFFEDLNNEEEEEEEEENIYVKILTEFRFVNYLKSAKSTLKELLTLRKMRNKEINDAISLFNKYMEDPELFDDYKIDKENYTWTQIKSSEDGWKDIADIAERLLSAVTSESSCERTISRHRLIHTNRRKKSKKELLDVRMILEST